MKQRRDLKNKSVGEHEAPKKTETKGDHEKAYAMALRISLKRYEEATEDVRYLENTRWRYGVPGAELKP